MDREKALSEVERVLIKHSAQRELKSLVNAGCDRGRLMAVLQLAFLTDESWRTLSGMDLRTFKSELRQVRHCAHVIDRLNRTDLMYRVSIEFRLDRFAGLYRSPKLPDQLREYAKAVGSLPQLLGPRHKHTLHAWKAHLVAIVLEQTGKAHDREVSALMAAVLENQEYSEKAHQAWRLKYGHLVERERVRIRSRHKSLAPGNPS
jgi:hypothetical protein